MAAYSDGVDEARTAIHREKERRARGVAANKHNSRNNLRFYLPLDEGEEMAYCCLERHRGEKVTAFHLHREDTGAFILACSCASDMEGPFKFHTLTDSHLRTMDAIPAAADSAVYLGMMDINFIGTEFVVRDHRWDDAMSARFSHELGLTVYETNVSGRAPNSMKVVVPRLHADQVTEENSPDTSLSERFAKVNTTRVRGSRLKRWFPRTAQFVAARRGSAGDAPLRIAASTPTAGGLSRSFSNVKKADAEDDEGTQEYCALEGDEMLDMTIFHTKKPVRATASMVFVRPDTVPVVAGLERRAPRVDVELQRPREARVEEELFADAARRGHQGGHDDQGGRPRLPPLRQDVQVPLQPRLPRPVLAARRARRRGDDVRQEARRDLGRGVRYSSVRRRAVAYTRGSRRELRRGSCSRRWRSSRSGGGATRSPVLDGGNIQRDVNL